VLVRFRVSVNTPGLDRAVQTYSRTVRNAMDKLGRHLQSSLRNRVRRARGDEQKNIRFEIRGEQLSLALDVFGDLMQLVIDEWGLAPGTFPPWDIGSRVFNYVKRLGLHRNPTQGRRKTSSMRRMSHVSTRQPRAGRAGGVYRPTPQAHARIGRVRRTAAPAREQSGRAVARAKAIRRIAFLVARKIFEHGIRARHPIANTFKANRAKIVRDLISAFALATRIINRGGQA
jgi:hypothetical protein